MPVTTFEMYFQDQRPPHAVQFHLERKLMTLLKPAGTDSTLVLKSVLDKNGVTFEIRLTFAATLPTGNVYHILLEGDWPAEPADPQQYYRKSTSSWIKYWTKDLMRCSPPDEAASMPERYRELVEEARQAEAHLTGVAEIQQEILRAMRLEGAWFTTSHKEGDTNIRLFHERFMRIDSGESNEVQTFDTEADFLAFLRRFYDWETSQTRRYPDRAPEYEAWKLILRLLRHPGAKS